MSTSADRETPIRGLGIPGPWTPLRVPKADGYHERAGDGRRFYAHDSPLDSLAQLRDTASMAKGWKIAVHAGFNEDGVWTIDARLRYAGGVIPPRRSVVRGNGRGALFEAVHREKLRGLDFYGAKRVSVHFDTGEEVVDFSPNEPFPEVITRDGSNPR